jgi:aspartyl-tRNA(Asn)/glutamyl-tRNA(Gln) amidotransferase subunit C
MFYTSCNGIGIYRTVNITKEEVTYTSGLAKIGMTDQDVDKFTTELDGILHWMEALNKIPIPDDLPVYIPQNLVGERDDANPTPDYSAQLMANAPDPQHNFFGVPKVIE